MKRLLVALIGLAICRPGVATAADSPAARPPLVRQPDSARTGRAAFVRVEDVPLVFTSQVFPRNLGGKVSAQTESALEVLSEELAKAGADLSGLARLNVYVAQERDVAAVEAIIAARFALAPPAVTLVCTALAQSGAAVGFDAVARSSRAPTGVEVIGSSTAILPAGAKLFISGQSIKAADLATGTRLTMAGLHRSVAHLGLKKTDVVQVKAFIKPMTDAAAAIREIGASFEGAPIPPIVLIEWISESPTEIELIASAKSLPPPAEAISYAWFPWLTKSPRYCHIGFVKAGTPLIFIGGIDGGEAGDARAQMKTIFERLGSTLFDAGSSYRHMAKATYYLVDPASRNLLGDVRDVYFDPLRPPAASALNLTTLGHPRRTASLDIIAVPAK